MEQKIEIWLIRHGKTPENEQHRYIGWLDSSLGSAGKAELIRASETVSKVWVTNRRRTQETAQILFPGAEQILVPGLEEMNFGSFEGKNFEEMQNDSAYRSWVESGCLDVCPGGESKAVFCSRLWLDFFFVKECFLQPRLQRFFEADPGMAAERTAGSLSGCGSRRHADGSVRTIRRTEKKLL